MFSWIATQHQIYMELKIDSTEKLYLHNDKLKNVPSTNIVVPKDAKIVYEVIRITKGVPLFFDQHINRLQQSLTLSNLPKVNDANLRADIKELLKANYVSEKNLKVAVYFANQQLEVYAFFIPSHYPPEDAYKNGVTVKLLTIERLRPNVKLENSTLRKTADSIIGDSNVYETLLVNDKGYITEGSRSNFFAIIDDKIITAPAGDVLEGITRKMVINLAKSNQFPIEERPIHTTEISLMSGAFITGTSPKVLPISQIENHKLHPIPKIITQLLLLYNELTQTTLKNESE